MINNFVRKSKFKNLRLTRFGRLASISILIFSSLLMFVPIYWVMVTSFSSVLDPILPPVWWPKNVNFENFATVFETIPLLTQVSNSLQVTTISVLGQLLVAVLAAFALSKLHFRGREAVFNLLLVGLMVPVQVTVIPIFLLMRNLGLIDTLPAIWLPTMLSVFSVFFLRQHFLSIPHDLDDAAKIDGAGPWRQLFLIYLPLSYPILSALAIFIAVISWNDFFWPNIMIRSPEKMTIPLGLVFLQAGDGGQGGAPIAVIFAGIAVVTIPLLILYLVAQDAVTRGISLAGVSR
jgi:ABC-type glycerol-3-phosphate transport system permease component